MPDKPGLLSAGTVLMNVLLLLILSSPAQGQSKRGLKAPPSLLEAIDPEDRDCVKQEGDLNKSVTVRRIQLSPKGVQLLVRGSGLCLCGAQNCGFWIYRRNGNRDELLLKGAGSVTVKLGKSVANGYRDIVADSHASAAETYVRTYRYDGRVYRLQRCVDVAYYDDNGKYTTKAHYRPCE